MPLFKTSFTAQTTTISTAISPAALNGSLVANVAKEVAPSNANRKSLTIFNTGSARIFLGYSDTVSLSNNFFLYLDAGDYYEMPTNILYTGDFWAISATNTTIAVYEGV